MVRDVIFIWIPKSAGYSIYHVLLKYGCPRERWVTPLVGFNNRGMVTFGHVKIQDLIANNVLTRDYFNKAFKFCFVRNPWDRLVSLFFYLRRIRNEQLQDCHTFPDFCKLLDAGEIPPVGLYNYRGLNQCNSQLDWIADENGEFIVDFVGRFENLENDFAKVCEMIGIHEKLQHANATPHRPYREYYDNELKALVGKLYKRDIEAFGYEF